MTRQELIELCLTFPAAYEDHPFDLLAKGNQWTAMRHGFNKKSFAFINELEGRLCVNLKCDPFEAEFLRQAFLDVIPGFHMNKAHWNTVFLNGDVPDEKLAWMIGHSYDLIKPVIRRKNMVNSIPSLIADLRGKDNQTAYQSLKALEAICADSDTVYPYFDTFAQMLGDANSYVRTRGMRLIAANAKWDADNQIEGLIDEYLTHIADEKPITARQCIKSLPTIARYKPDLSDSICRALQAARPQIYPSTMQPLVDRDMQEALNAIHESKEGTP